jgi:hypothetical protein
MCDSGNAFVMLRKVQRVDLTLGTSDPLQSVSPIVPHSLYV